MGHHEALDGLVGQRPFGGGAEEGELESGNKHVFIEALPLPRAVFCIFVLRTSSPLIACVVFVNGAHARKHRSTAEIRSHSPFSATRKRYEKVRFNWNDASCAAAANKRSADAACMPPAR